MRKPSSRSCARLWIAFLIVSAIVDVRVLVAGSGSGSDSRCERWRNEVDARAGSSQKGHLTVAAAEDLIDESGLPGQEPLPSGVGSFRQFSGYVVTDVAAGRALFYYFVEAQSKAISKPLTLWLNGGPGCSSVGNGAFEELGPFRPNGTARGLRFNRHSWNAVSNLLFLESPAGVGFSYSNTSSDLKTNDAKTAKDSLMFLLGWFEKFPQYKCNKLFLAGESYAGHYIPQLASLLFDYNNKHGSRFFNLEGITVGNPLLDLGVDTYATYSYLWSHGVVSDETFNGVTNDCNFADYTETSTGHNESKSCNNLLNTANTEVGNFINFYNVEIDVCYSSIAQQELRLNQRVHNFSLGVDVCLDSEVEFYFNLPEVQKALHANTTRLDYSWALCSSHKSLNYSYADQTIEMKPYLANILNHGVRLWIYSLPQA
ncbi:hypothetical protein KP509_17G021700 [Ceratopteris richardii]|uniref:Carboxypeptidase n=1 Tax=Ceratopteris richardii TaxID=49495 RepID=A0A8T2SW72_CERRI|nr:hypothetical protein KP509_17G021700 [Ceratopteris richardii]